NRPGPRPRVQPVGGRSQSRPNLRAESAEPRMHLHRRPAALPGSGAGGRVLCRAGMKHAIYEDPITRRFAIIRLPIKFADGDKLPILPTTQWFGTREEVIATLPELFNQDE